MHGLFVATAMNIVFQIKEEERFNKSLESLTSEERQKAIDKRKEDKDKERRHRELCQAIRDSKPDKRYFY